MPCRCDRQPDPADKIPPWVVGLLAVLLGFLIYLVFQQ